jgi:hypothetical protein
MAKTVFNDAIIACLSEIHSRLTEAGQMKPAQTLAALLKPSRFRSISSPLHEAASLLNRLSQA